MPPRGTALVLSCPAVQAAKNNWNEQLGRRRAKHNVTFDQLFNLFNSGIRQIRIAEVVGLSRERVRQIYDSYFRDLYDGRSGRQRYQAYTREKRLDEAEQRENERLSGLQPIVQRALAAGCAVEFVRREKNRSLGRKFERRLLAINGQRCFVYPSLSNAVNQSARSRRRYVPIRLLHRSVSAVQALVFQTLINEFPEHIFVIPSKVLLKSYFTTVRESSVIYLPTEKVAEYLNHRPRVDFWQYENAWHLLASKRTARSPRTFWSAY